MYSIFFFNVYSNFSLPLSLSVLCASVSDSVIQCALLQFNLEKIQQFQFHTVRKMKSKEII